MREEAKGSIEEAGTEEAGSIESAPDLSELRWQSRDAVAMGITFFGTVHDGAYVLESRRLAGVPLRFALEEPVRFADSCAMLVALLEASPIHLGPDKARVESGSKPPPIGEYPLYLDPAQEPPAAYFRRLRESFGWKSLGGEILL